MPRIDLWAIDETCGEDAKQSEGSPNACKSSGEVGVDAAKNSSQAWNSFVEQVDSVCASGSINILVSFRFGVHYYFLSFWLISKFMQAYVLEWQLLCMSLSYTDNLHHI